MKMNLLTPLRLLGAFENRGSDLAGRRTLGCYVLGGRDGDRELEERTVLCLGFSICDLRWWRWSGGRRSGVIDVLVVLGNVIRCEIMR